MLREAMLTLTLLPGWISPHDLQQQLVKPATPVNRTFRDGIDGPVQPGQIVSVASLAGLHDVAPTLEPGTWVMYDVERWSFTPAEERAAPYRSMRRFVTAARGYGMVAVLAPGHAFRERAARRDADMFVAQVQAITDPERYRDAVCRLARRFDGPLYAELTANGRPGHRARDLYRQWRAGRRCTRLFALWSPPPVTARNVRTANRFLSMLP